MYTPDPDRSPRTVRWTVLAATVLACLATTVAQATAGVRTGELDDREYRRLVLDNGLEVMLVSDPETDKSAASLDVAVGHGNDPPGRQGLAHFLEHMLFLGTEKYPEAGEYQAFIKDHGGSHNAYTTYDHTNYFFSVSPAFLEGALDRFAQFFIAPLFNPEFVRRERVIVDSEYSARSDEEGRRTLGALRQAFNPAHPRSEFAVGSLETLADREGAPVRDDLVRFYEANYSAHLMKLAVIGRESLDDLETWVRARFPGVRRTDAERFVADVPLLRPSDMPMMLEVAPLKERRELAFTFEVPSTIGSYREKPVHQIANILGHEGEGSLLAALKARGWAGGLSAGAGSMDVARGLLDVRISLTSEGERHVGEIGEMLFSAIATLRERGIERWRYEEQKRLADIGFRFSEKIDAVSLVRSIADRMHDYPWQDVLYAPYAFERFAPGIVQDFVDRLRPQNVLVTLVSPAVKPQSVDQWFDTGYTLGALDDDLLDRWREPGEFAELTLPAPNPFVPDRLEMVADVEAGGKPRRVIDEPGLTLWHHTDTTFGTPRAEFYFSFRSPRAATTPREAALVDLFTMIIEDRLNAFSYPAYLAGLGFYLYPHLRGFSVRVSGFDERQGRLIGRIAERLRAGEFDPGRFRRLREQQAEDYRNRLKDSPSGLAVSELQRLLIEDAWPIEARIEALDDIDLASFNAFVDAFFEQGNLLVLSVGNRLESDSTALARSLADVLLDRVDPAHVPRSSVVRLQPGQEYERLIDSPHNDSVVALYRQGADDSYAERALFYLYDQLSDSAFYTSLRTEQKLGYVVQSFAIPILDVPGMMFLVQSPNAGVATTEKAIREFIAGFGDQVGNLSADAMARARASLLSRINQRDDALPDRADRYWRELDDEEFEFDSRERLSAAVEATTIGDMQQFVRRFGGPSTPALVIHAAGSVASGDGDSGQVTRLTILDHAAFKQSHAVF